MKYTESTECYAVKESATMIDMIDPKTGLTSIGGKTADQVRDQYPGAEVMTIGGFCDFKANRQRSPIAWVPVTEAQYDEMLCVLPPAEYGPGGFLVGEPVDNDAGNGKPRFDAFRRRGLLFERSNRPLTRAEFRKAI